MKVKKSSSSSSSLSSPSLRIQDNIISELMKSKDGKLMKCLREPSAATQTAFLNTPQNGKEIMRHPLLSSTSKFETAPLCPRVGVCNTLQSSLQFVAQAQQQQQTSTSNSYKIAMSKTLPVILEVVSTEFYVMRTYAKAKKFINAGRFHKKLQQAAVVTESSLDESTTTTTSVSTVDIINQTPTATTEQQKKESQTILNYFRSGRTLLKRLSPYAPTAQKLLLEALALLAAEGSLVNPDALKILDAEIDELYKRMEKNKYLFLSIDDGIARAFNQLSAAWERLGNFERALVRKKQAVFAFECACRFDFFFTSSSSSGNKDFPWKEFPEVRKKFVQENMSWNDRYNAAVEELKIQYRAKTNKNILVDKDIDNVNVAALYTNIGLLLENAGERHAGLRQKQRGLDILMRIYADDNHENDRVATTMNNLGVSFQQVGEQQKGFELQMKALELRRKIYGGEGGGELIISNRPHPKLASSLNNVGASLEGTHRRAEGVQYLRGAFEMHKALSPGGSRNYAMTLANLGAALLHDDATLGEAQSFLKDSIRMFDEHSQPGQQQQLPEGEDVAISYSNLGIIAEKMKNFDESIEMKMKALEIRKKWYGEPACWKSDTYAASLGAVGDALLAQYSRNNATNDTNNNNRNSSSDSQFLNGMKYLAHALRIFLRLQSETLDHVLAVSCFARRLEDYNSSSSIIHREQYIIEYLPILSRVLKDAPSYRRQETSQCFAHFLRDYPELYSQMNTHANAAHHARNTEANRVADVVHNNVNSSTLLLLHDEHRTNVLLHDKKNSSSEHSDHDDYTDDDDVVSHHSNVTEPDSNYEVRNGEGGIDDDDSSVGTQIGSAVDDDLDTRDFFLHQPSAFLSSICRTGCELEEIYQISGNNNNSSALKKGRPHPAASSSDSQRKASCRVGTDSIDGATVVSDQGTALYRVGTEKAPSIDGAPTFVFSAEKKEKPGKQDFVDGAFVVSEIDKKNQGKKETS